jgi:hypothetical protein
MTSCVRAMAHTAMAALIALLAASSPGNASTLLWTISGDPNDSYVPDILSTVVPGVQPVTEVARLGDGSVYAFNGGLTFGSGALYGIANDSSGASSLFQIQPTALTLIGSAGGLGSGFFGGLTWDSQNSTFYAAVLDDQGNTTLDSISGGGVATALGKSLGTGYSGLAFDSTNNLFYGIGNDGSGASTLYDFSIDGAVNFVAGLGFGFGGLTYDAANDVFWAIDPVNNEGSELLRITPAGVETIPLLMLGDGFVELAAAPAAAPEPGTAGEIGAGLIGIAWALKKTIHKNTEEKK